MRRAAVQALDTLADLINFVHQTAQYGT